MQTTSYPNIYCLNVIAADNYRHEHNQLNTYCRAALGSLMTHDFEDLDEFTEKIFPSGANA